MSRYTVQIKVGGRWSDEEEFSSLPEAVDTAADLAIYVRSRVISGSLIFWDSKR